MYINEIHMDVIHDTIEYAMEICIVVISILNFFIFTISLSLTIVKLST